MFRPERSSFELALSSELEGRIRPLRVSGGYIHLRSGEGTSR